MVSGTSKFVLSFYLGSFPSCMWEEWSEGFEGLRDWWAFGRDMKHIHYFQKSSVLESHHFFET